MKIIFLCHGNICRSPMAEFIMKHLLDESGLSGIEVVSRAAHHDEIGSDIYPPAARTLDAHAVPHTPRRATFITERDFLTADLVAVMDGENYRDMRRMFGQSDKVRKLPEFYGSDGDVADPWYTRDFEAAYADIYKGCKAILERLIDGKSLTDF